METVEIESLKLAMPYFMKHPNIWVNYDTMADVLYLHFKKPNLADDAQMADDGTIVRYANDEIIGLTITDATQKLLNQ